MPHRMQALVTAAAAALGNRQATSRKVPFAGAAEAESSQCIHNEVRIWVHMRCTHGPTFAVDLRSGKLARLN